MKLGANSVLFGGYDMATAFAQIALAGYDGIELSAIDGMSEHLVLARWRDLAAEIRKLSADTGLELLAMSTQTDQLVTQQRRVRNHGVRPRMALTFCVLVVLGAIFFSPFVWLMMTSFKPEEDIFRTLLPHRWVWSNYARGLTHFPFTLYLRNTLFLCTMRSIARSRYLPLAPDP